MTTLEIRSGETVTPIPDTVAAEAAARDFLAALGVDTDTPGTLETPGRMARAWAEMLVDTWLPEGYTEPLRDWDIYAMRGTTVAYADITTSAADLDYYRDALDIILPSMSMTDP